MKKICIELINEKKINLNLYDEYAPLTVANFMHLIDIKFYDNVIFHRVIKDFMAQAGAYIINNEEIQQKSVNYTIPGEFAKNGWANVISHKNGVISMARTNEFNSASTQFFICDKTEANNTFMDGQYAAFGIVADEESLEVVHELCWLPTININEQFANFPQIDTDKFTIKTIYELE